MSLWEFGALGWGEVWGVPGDVEPSLWGSGRAEMKLLGRSFRTRIWVWFLADPFQISGDPPQPLQPQGLGVSLPWSPMSPRAQQNPLSSKRGHPRHPLILNSFYIFINAVTALGEGSLLPPPVPACPRVPNGDRP